MTQSSTDRPWEALRAPRQIADLLGLDAVIPPTMALALECKLFVAELMAALAERVAEVGERVEALDKRVAAPEAKPQREASGAKAD